MLDVIDPSTAEVDRARAGRRTSPTSTAPCRRRARRSTRVPGRTRPRRTAAACCSSWRRSCARAATSSPSSRRRNTGKPIVEAEFDIADVATCFEYYGGLATKIHGDVIPVPDNAMSLALREPIGVAGQIIPWNYPLLMASWKLAPAICAGCTTVLKPAEQTPLTALALASSFADAGLPPGVVNIVTGAGDTTGAAIVEHADVDKIAFTGSVEVGKTIMRSAADTLKKISLELGGKSPNIFFADADFEAAVEGALFGVFFNQGEVCSAGSRILVQRSIYKRFVDAMVEKARTITVGLPLDRDTKMGALVSREQFDRVREYQEHRQARSQAGDRRRPRHRRGARARLLRRADDLLRRRQLRAHRARGDFRTGRLRHPVRRARRTRCGSPTTPTTDSPPPSGRATSSARCARSSNLRAGIVWVNHMQPTYVEAPWGGYKQSGIGRELGKWGVEEYLNVKQVYINLSEQPIGWY